MALVLFDVQREMRYVLKRGSRWRVGRSVEGRPADIDCQDSQVAPLHCEVAVDPAGRPWVRDRQGLPIRLDGQPLPPDVPRELHAGSRLVLGADYAFRVENALAEPTGTPAGSGVVSTLTSARTLGTSVPEAESAAVASTGGASRAAAQLPDVPGYTVLRRLGGGGMGDVFEAEHEEFGRVALKVVKPEAGPREVARLIAREARALAKVRHAHVVRIHEAGLAGDLPFVAMELVKGGSLRDRLAASPQGRLSPREAAALCAALARALQHVHERGLLHRDIKPGNILLDDRGRRPVLTDFGLARTIDQETRSRLTRTGAPVGTPAYMPPEQLHGLRQLTPAVDIYALGATLYELLAGCRPFEHDSIHALFYAIDNEVPRALRQHDAAIPAALERVCRKCLDKVPSARYASAAELADDLERYLRGIAVVARPPDWQLRMGRVARRHRAAAFVLLSLLLALGVGRVTWLLGGSSTATDETQRARDSILRPLPPLPRSWRQLAGRASAAQLVAAAQALRELEGTPYFAAATPAAQDAVQADIAHIHSLLVEHLRDTYAQLHERVERWSNEKTRLPRDDRLGDDAKTAADLAGEVAALGWTPAKIDSAGPNLAHIARWTSELHALLRFGHVDRWATGVSDGLLDGESLGPDPNPVLAPPWGVVVTGLQEHSIRAARLYTPSELLETTELPRPRTQGRDLLRRTKGLVVIEAPGLKPFLIELEEVSHKRLQAAQVSLAPEPDDKGPARGVTWAVARSAEPLRRPPTVDEWKAAAAVAPWSGSSALAGPGPSPTTCRDMAGGVREWAAVPRKDGSARATLIGGTDAAPSLHERRGPVPTDDRDPQVGARWVVDLPGE